MGIRGNMGSSIALIHKQNPDDISFVLELLKPWEMVS